MKKIKWMSALFLVALLIVGQASVVFAEESDFTDETINVEMSEPIIFESGVNVSREGIDSYDVSTYSDNLSKLDIPLSEWSLQTLDGRSINQNTYADKTVLFVFYRATMNDGVGICYNSRNLIANLANSAWVKNDKLQVIAIDGANNTASAVSQYKQTYAPDCDDIVFALNGSNLMWSLCRQALGTNGLTFSFCVVIRDNTIHYAWDSCSDGEECREVLIQELGKADFITNTTVGLGVEGHTTKQIQDFANAHPASLNQTSITYKTSPSLSSPYSPGVLSDDTLNSALNMLNQVRYIAGVDANVTLDATQSEYASAGSLLNYLNNSLSHYPNRPSVLSDSAYDSLYEMGYKGTSGSNIASGYFDLNNAIVKGWCADADASNIDRVGHRRWFLSPYLSSVGFGATGRYSAAYVSHNFYDDWEGIYVAWPAQTMPIEYFDASYPWSLSLGRYPWSTSVRNLDNVSVKLVRKSDKKAWNFSNSGVDGNFYVNTGGYGSPACIIFRPSNLTSIASDDSFDVTVTISGEMDTTSIVYTVNFFSLNDATSGATNLATPKITNIVDSGNGIQITWNAVDGAKKYRVLYKTGSGEWTKAGDTTSASYTWTGAKRGTTYWFTVCCINDDGSYASDYDTKGQSFTYVVNDGNYYGDVNTELLNFSYDNNTGYLSGQIVVVEWVDTNGDGVKESTVPEYAPTMTFASIDGTEEIEVFVTPTGTNTYYFDRLIGELSPNKEFAFYVTSGNPKNISKYRIVPVYTGTSGIGSEGKLGISKTNNTQSIRFKTSREGYLLLYGRDENLPYEGHVNSLLTDVSSAKSANGTFVSGHIIVTEWINGESTVPRTTPVMTFESYDGSEVNEVFMLCLDGTNTYYFDRNLSEKMDVNKEYIFKLSLTEPENISSLKSMVVTTNYMDAKEGLLWETDTQQVLYKTVWADKDNQLRVYAVNK